MLGFLFLAHISASHRPLGKHQDLFSGEAQTHRFLYSRVEHAADGRGISLCLGWFQTLGDSMSPRASRRDRARSPRAVSKPSRVPPECVRLRTTRAGSSPTGGARCSAGTCRPPETRAGQPATAAWGTRAAGGVNGTWRGSPCWAVLVKSVVRFPQAARATRTIPDFQVAPTPAKTRLRTPRAHPPLSFSTGVSTPDGEEPRRRVQLRGGGRQTVFLRLLSSYPGQRTHAPFTLARTGRTPQQADPRPRHTLT